MIECPTGMNRIGAAREIAGLVGCHGSWPPVDNWLRNQQASKLSLKGFCRSFPGAMSCRPTLCLSALPFEDGA